MWNFDIPKLYTYTRFPNGNVKKIGYVLLMRSTPDDLQGEIILS